jgi:hypothetical protein
MVNGGRDWDRTSDPCDVNAVLIPLSYAPDLPMGFALYIGSGRRNATPPRSGATVPLPASGREQAPDLVDQVPQVERL